VSLLLFIQLFLHIFQTVPEHPGVEDPLPSCILYRTNAEPVYTDSLKGNILVLDFWASWNAPSRKHNMQLIKMHEKYRQYNFRRKKQVLFLSVSMDTQPELWLIARAKDDLHWPYNFCDFKGWESPLATQLNLYRIPANFVVDETGKIVGKDLWGTRLDSLLQSLQGDVPN
jgi:thiol-disulfide isomerase/thioredoxin